MQFLWRACIIVALVFSPLFFLSCIQIWAPDQFTLEFEAKSTARGVFELFLDRGRGFYAESRQATPLVSGNTLSTYRLAIPPGRYLALRIDPGETSGETSIENIRIADARGEIVIRLSTDELLAANDVDKVIHAGTSAIAYVSKPVGDPQLVLKPASAIDLSLSWRYVFGRLLRLSALYAFLILACATVIEIVGRRAQRGSHEKVLSFRAVAPASPRHPVLTVAIAGLSGAVLATYPIVFFNRSFVSPTVGAHILYRVPPFIPGSADMQVWSADGADVGAGLWQNVPYSFIQYRAVFQDHEVPLWNRYNSAGRPLLGQGISQFLDPLEWLPILAGGNAWGWDLKFVFARVLFAVGIGLLVLRTTGHLPSAIAMAISASFLGYFLLRFNHPAYFSPIFAPWIILAWTTIVESSTRRGRLVALSVVLAASVAQVGTGTPKEGTITLLVAHLAGLLNLVFSSHDFRRKLNVLMAMIVLGTITICITAPQWLIFYDTLVRNATVYSTPRAEFATPSQFAGLFLGRLAGHLSAWAGHPWIIAGFNPFVLIMLAWSVVKLPLLIRQRTFVAFALTGGGSLAVAFGLVPTKLILAIPFINNIHHLGDTFVCASLAPMFVVAGFGMREMWQAFGARNWLLQEGVISLGLVLLVASAFVDSDYNNYPGLLKMALGITVLAVLLLPLFFRWAIELNSGRAAFVAGVTAAAAFIIIHAPLGMHLRTNTSADSGLFFVPGQRPNFYAPSRAVEFIRSRSSQPYRIAGVDLVMMAGVQSIYEVESICGADPLFTPTYEELIDALGIFRNPMVWFNFVREGDIPRIDPALDLLGVRFLLADYRSNVALTQGTLVRYQADLTVFERPTAWPRAFYASKARIYEKASEIASMAYEEPGRPFAAVQRSDAEGISRLERAISASDEAMIVPADDYKLTSNSTRFRVGASGPGVIVLMEAFWKGHHHVTVNGTAVPSVRLNHAFIGIPIDSAGQYDVTVKFEPAIWPVTRGLFIMGSLGWVLILAGGLYSGRPNLRWSGRLPKKAETVR